MSEIDVEFELDSSLTSFGSGIKFTVPALDGVLGVFKLSILTSEAFLRGVDLYDFEVNFMPTWRRFAEFPGTIQMATIWNL